MIDYMLRTTEKNYKISSWKVKIVEMLEYIKPLPPLILLFYSTYINFYATLQFIVFCRHQYS